MELVRRSVALAFALALFAAVAACETNGTMPDGDAGTGTGAAPTQPGGGAGGTDGGARRY